MKHAALAARAHKAGAAIFQPTTSPPGSRGERPSNSRVRTPDQRGSCEDGLVESIKCVGPNVTHARSHALSDRQDRGVAQGPGLPVRAPLVRQTIMMSWNGVHAVCARPINATGRS